ncbi:glutathione S-transferase domain-containing protein [Annulohypoxylon maeteangense]|uniref:glutathione S-transferase domain-containing protein n=1 Tax=Annulohypoxylon maeteangense TaxID=1927788 RepID=UPI002008A9BA|nr:glutathione S-transferase domain-containing protein [Annulohypoxylon maeteangense]KAI0880524.1 glutathione S-transferase domain-containing protein [Annulohypoxylon maeteangense]
MSAPKVKLYTNHGCPWAHRAHISLAELKLPFEEEIIDLSTPRTPEYLKINPRGLVPSLEYNGEILTESAIISNFLANEFPSHLIPLSNAPGGALFRAKVDFFVDTFISKVTSNFFKALHAKTDEEVEGFVKEYVDAVVKEIEPLLGNAAPFFNGSDKLTQAEVLTGSFVVRLFTLPRHGLFPEHILGDLSTRAPNFYRWGQAVSKHPSVLVIYDEEVIAARTKERLAKLRAA